MKAFVEHLSGIIRIGDNCLKYGDPYDFAVAWSSVDGKTAIIKGLVSTSEKKFTIRHARACIRALKNIGLEAEWERVK